MRDRHRIAVVGGLVLLAIVAHSARAPEPDRRREPAPLPPAAWAEAATQTCRTIQSRISAFGHDHWRPLTENRPLARVAILRRQLLDVQEGSARGLRARGAAPPGAATHALALHAYMLDTIRDVIRAAERGDADAYAAANLRMAYAIETTRGAWKRAGADRSCDFAF